jgi:hypothetical protein
MMKYVFYLFLAYILYQLIFKFIIPLYRTTRQVKKGFREMQERMNQQMQQQQTYADQSQQPDRNSKSSLGDYIEFEEVPPAK